MNVLFKRGSVILFIGDIALFFVSLVLMLFLRFGEGLDFGIFYKHASSFSILFFLWCLVFFIAGLYEKHTVVFQRSLPRTLLAAQTANIIVAIIFFYFVPTFGITPKTNLFVYLLISFPLVLLWRMYGYTTLRAGRKYRAILIGSGKELKELRDEVNHNFYSNLTFVSTLDLDAVASTDFQEEIVKLIYTEEISIVVIDFKNQKIQPLLSHLYKLMLSNITFIDMHQLYEDIFNRIPLSLITYDWVLENISLVPKVGYDFGKRVMDVSAALVLGAFSLIFYPIVFLLIKFDDNGKLFIFQDRVGKNNKMVRIIKFRTMTTDDGGNYEGKKENRLTRVGPFLRKSRIDELPQIWNVLKGDISLIGPRPELPTLVKTYEEEIAFYGARHLIKPGLSGWAQVYHDNHPHHAVAVEATKEKLSYDLYYLKNRSFILDIKISLKTVRKLLSRSGL